MANGSIKFSSGMSQATSKSTTDLLMLKRSGIDSPMVIPLSILLGDLATKDELKSLIYFQNIELSADNYNADIQGWILENKFKCAIIQIKRLRDNTNVEHSEDDESEYAKYKEKYENINTYIYTMEDREDIIIHWGKPKTNIIFYAEVIGILND